MLAEPIVRVIFERGAFTPRDTLATAAALQFYAVGLLGYSVVRIVSPIFYALGRNRTPVIVSIDRGARQRGAQRRAGARRSGYRGLALGTSIAALFNAATLLVVLRSASARHPRRRACSARSRGSRSPPVAMGAASPLV